MVSRQMNGLDTQAKACFPLGGILRGVTFSAKIVQQKGGSSSVFLISRTQNVAPRAILRLVDTDLNYWIKLLSCIIEANGGHIGLSHINLHWYY